MVFYIFPSNGLGRLGKCLHKTVQSLRPGLDERAHSVIARRAHRDVFHLGRLGGPHLRVHWPCTLSVSLSLEDGAADVRVGRSIKALFRLCVVCVCRASFARSSSTMAQTSLRGVLAYRNKHSNLMIQRTYHKEWPWTDMSASAYGKMSINNNTCY